MNTMKSIWEYNIGVEKEKDGKSVYESINVLLDAPPTIGWSKVFDALVARGFIKNERTIIKFATCSEKQYLILEGR